MNIIKCEPCRTALERAKRADELAVANGYTPGPWKIDYDESASPNLWIDAKGNAGIAKIEIHEHEGRHGESLDEEDWANARLIASAPDLLVRAERAEALVAQLRDALEETRRIICETTTLRCAHPAEMEEDLQEHGECLNIDDCMFHGILQPIQEAIAAAAEKCACGHALHPGMPCQFVDTTDRAFGPYQCDCGA